MSINLRRIVYPLMAICTITPLLGAANMVHNPTANASRTSSLNIRGYAEQRQYYHHPSVAWNERSLGNMPAADGRKIKPNTLFRSSELGDISDSGKAELKRQGINQIIDLRYMTDHGIAGQNDPGEDDNAYLTGTDMGYQFAPVYYGGEFHGIANFYGDPAVTNHNAINAYQDVFDDLLDDSDGATLFHCNSGRDRTGVVSVLVEAALGVSKRNIYKDYLLTYHYDGQKNYSYEASKLDRFYSTIDSHYGSMRNYLHDGVGLSSSQISKLRSMYLD